MASERTAIETLRRLGIEDPTKKQIEYLQSINGNSLAMPLILEYLDKSDLSYGSIAARLGVSVDAVKWAKRIQQKK